MKTLLNTLCGLILLTPALAFASSKTYTGAQPYFWKQSQYFNSDASNAKWCFVTVEKKKDIFLRSHVRFISKVYPYQNITSPLDLTENGPQDFYKVSSTSSTSQWFLESQVAEALKTQNHFSNHQGNNETYKKISLKKVSSLTQNILQLDVNNMCAAVVGWRTPGDHTSCQFSFQNPDHPPVYEFIAGQPPILK